MLRHFFVAWTEKYFYQPTTCQRFVSFLLLPFSFAWCVGGKVRRRFAKPIDYKIPIISVGNINVGGTGKTPISIAIAKELKNATVILRGYKRNTKGMLIVKKQNRIMCGVEECGDEAMLYAKETDIAIVIVSENRANAIQKAKDLGAKTIILDDGFGKIDIKKFDILIRPNPKPFNSFCLPSGSYRESVRSYEKADLVLEENVNFERSVTIENASEKMFLATAIANPSRLDKYLTNDVIGKKTFADHYAFKKDELEKLIQKSGAKTILATTKDAVKMEKFDLPVSLLKLTVKLSPDVIKSLKNYIKNCK